MVKSGLAKAVHQPVVERSDFVLDLATEGGRVSRAEIERLHGWFQSIGLRYGDSIAVDEGYGAGRARDDVALAVINSNYALGAGLNPVKDALAIESKDSPYANIVAIRTGDDSRAEIQKLKAALTSAEVKKFIETEYKGAVVPAF